MPQSRIPFKPENAHRFSLKDGRWYFEDKEIFGMPNPDVGVKRMVREKHYNITLESYVAIVKEELNNYEFRTFYRVVIEDADGRMVEIDNIHANRFASDLGRVII